MHRVAISSTGLFTPPQTISNTELVEAYNQYAALENARYADEIAAGSRAALTDSSVEFIEKASGIQRRYVMDKAGVLDPTRMRPRFAPRPDTEISMMAEIGVLASQAALDAAGKTAADVDGLICAAANMQRPYPAMGVEIQTALGIQGYAFDMNVACSSATFALELAVNAVRTGQARAILVVNPEITSAHLAWKDRDCHFIFGDVCTAILVERLDLAPEGAFEILGTRLLSTFSNNIRNNQALCRGPKTATPTTVTSCFARRAARCSRKSAPWRPTTSPGTWSRWATPRPMCAAFGCTRPICP
jgi:beta-ketodecanoyl-[acyl-carrier-protein] synthase